MTRMSALICAGLLLLSVAAAQDFTQYSNSFSNGKEMDVGPDGTVWYKVGSQLVRLDPQSADAQCFALPMSTPGEVSVDSTGAAWVYCNLTICRVFDGLVQAFPLHDGMGKALAASPDGTVWAAGRRLAEQIWLLMRYENGQWHDILDGPSRKGAEAICFEADGTGWFLYPDGVARYSEGEWAFFEHGFDPLPPDCAIGSPGELYVTQTQIGAVQVFQDGVLAREYKVSDGLAGNFPERLDVDTLGRVWVSDQFDAGVSMFDGQSWTVFNTLNSGLPSNHVGDIAASPDGSVFFTTATGVARYHNGFWNVCSGRETMVVNNDVWSVAVNEQGQVFYGTYYGQIGYKEGSTWTVLREDPMGLFPDNVYDILFSPSGSIWFGCHHCLRVWRGLMAELYNTGSGGIALQDSTALCLDQSGEIWICARYGVARRDEAHFSWTSWGTGDNWPISACCDQEGKVWIGTDDGLAVLENGELTRWLPEYGYVDAIACDQDGVMWLGFSISSKRGVLEFDGENEIAWYTIRDGLPSNAISCIECDSANHIWVGTSDGLGYFDRSQWTKYNIDSGFPVNEIRDIFAAPNGDVWFATPAGLICRESGVEPPKLSISIATDRNLYRAGETMTVSLSYQNPGPDIFIDIQIACQLPDGSLYYYPGGDTPVPFSSGMLPSGTSIPIVLVLRYEFPSGFPVGGYTWMTAMFQQGTFNILTDIATAPFTFE